MVFRTIPSAFVFFLLAGVPASGCDSGDSASNGDDQTSPPTPPATVAAVGDYRAWGWEAFVLQNGYVTLAAVPAIGGRVMEFALGTPESSTTSHDAMWRNPQTLGQTPTPNPNIWPNHGGYKNWPAPQGRWGWPPPPMIDYGSYSPEITFQSADSVSLFLRGPVEEFHTPGLRFERTITLYRGSSRVRVDQTLVNTGTAPVLWSVWDVTQHPGSHGSQQDYDNFRVYFPINPQSRHGSEGVRTDGPSAAWAGEASPGIYEVVFRPDNRKLFADSRGGWICYVDLRDGYAYAKTFEIFAELEYPDEGSDVEVYVSSQGYVEVEVLGPLVSIPVDVGFNFREEWWASRTSGPVIAVNRVGLANEPLTVRRSTGAVTGTFGVFHVGRAYVGFFDDAGAEVARSAEAVVRPDALLSLSRTETIPATATRARVMVDDPTGTLIGVLDQAEIGD